jgi:hypothetical protein
MSEIVYRQYVGESDLPHIMALVQNELSEPYVIYTFRYFLHQWSVFLLYVWRIMGLNNEQASSIFPREHYILGNKPQDGS